MLLHTPTVTAEWQAGIGTCAQCPSHDSILVQDEWIWVQLKPQKAFACHEATPEKLRHCEGQSSQVCEAALTPQNQPKSVPSEPFRKSTDELWGATAPAIMYVKLLYAHLLEGKTLPSY